MGVYLIIRFNLIFELSYLCNYILICIGALTVSLGSLVAIFQTDIKKLVAYSTISQMGYLVFGCGFLAYDETIIYLIMHAINKAFLFIIVGYTVHFFNSNTDLRQMGGFSIYSFDIFIFFISLSLNLIGLPFSSGFYSKEFLLFQIFDSSVFSIIFKSLIFISLIFTPMYMFVMVFSVNFNLKKNFYKNYNSLNKNNFNFFFKKYKISSFFSVFEINYIISKSTVFILVSF